MIKRTIIFISHFLFICLNFYNANAQYGYTLLDSCFEYSGSYDSTYSRTYLIISDSGNYSLSQTMSRPDTIWTTLGSNYIRVFSSYNLYDSLGRIIECDQLQDSLPPLQYYFRTIFSYDSFGNMNDSLEQTFIANTWVNSNEWKWEYDSASHPIFREWKSWSGRQWLNNSRTEWYYDSSSRDTLNVIFIGDTNNWIPQYKNHYIYSSFGMVDSFNTFWTGTAWINQFRGQFFYRSLNQDTLDIFYDGNINSWDSSREIRNSFDSLGNKIYTETLFYVAPNWKSQTQSFYTYDSLHRMTIKIDQHFDTLGWQNDFKDSICYNHDFDIENYIQYWNGATWYCSKYEFQTGNHVMTGILDLDCTVGGYDSDLTSVYDSNGRLIYIEFDGHAGQSHGTTSYYYDDIGFLYKQISQASTMGGIINDSYCYHYRPLVFSFDSYFYDLCPPDPIEIASHVSGGAYSYNYQWRFNNQILSDTLAVLSGFSVQHSGWLSLTLSDTARNYYIDSIFLQIHPDVNLGNDTIVCQNTILTLNPGNYSSYLWQNGSTTEIYSAFSPVADTILYWVQASDSTGCTNRESLTIIFDVCQLILVVDKFEFNIFPNPTTGHITITITDQSPINEITITNTFGQEVCRARYSNTSKLDLEIKGESGLYFVKIVSGVTSRIYKVVKM